MPAKRRIHHIDPSKPDGRVDFILNMMGTYRRVSSKGGTRSNLLLRTALKHVENVALGAREKTEKPCGRQLLPVGERGQRLALGWWQLRQRQA